MGKVNSSVRVLGVSRVTPAEHVGGQAKLSFLDAPWIALPPVQLVFLYELPRADDCFSSVVGRLKESLAAALALYLPLAGRLVYVAETRDIVLDWSDADAGVAFIEGEGDDLDVRRLAGDEVHDVLAFRGLVPELDARVLPAPVLSVQATRLGGGGGGGMALGVSVHHAAVDGVPLWGFIDAWVSACRHGSPVSLGSPPCCYGREAIVHPRGDELARELLHNLAPNLPVVKATDYDTRRFELGRRTFCLGAQDVRSLTRLIDGLASAEAPPHWKPVSTYVALSALGWTAFVRSKRLAAGEEDTHLVFFADLRGRLDPPVDAAYLGNCLKACVASADAGDLAGEAGLLRAARAIQAAVREMEAAPLAGVETCFDRAARLPASRRANVASSPSFRPYDRADFGFGRPARVEPVSMNNDGEMALFGGRRAGEVQLTVSLDPARMDAFKAHVLAACRGKSSAGRSDLTRRARL